MADDDIFSYPHHDDGRGFRRTFGQTRENGVVTRQGTLTTSSGKTVTRDARRSCRRGECSGSSVVTGPRGRQWGQRSNVLRTGCGQWQGEVTRTGPRGRRATTNGPPQTGHHKAVVPDQATALTKRAVVIGAALLSLAAIPHAGAREGWRTLQQRQIAQAQEAAQKYRDVAVAEGEGWRLGLSGEKIA